MEKLSLDEIMRQYNTNKFIILHSEGPILTIEIQDEKYIVHFNQENSQIELTSSALQQFVEGQLILKSPSGKSYDTNINGEWSGMIDEKNIQFLFKYL